MFCDEIAEVYRNDEWRLGHRKGKADEPVKHVPREVFDQVVEAVSDLENMPDLAELHKVGEMQIKGVDLEENKQT